MDCRPQAGTNLVRYIHVIVINISTLPTSPAFKGSYGSSGTYSCPYGDCYRVSSDMKDKRGNLVPTNRGRWVLGQPFTLNHRQLLYERSQEETGGDPKKLARDLGHKYKGCKHPPCDIVDHSRWDDPIITILSPQPLHILIGLGSSTVFLSLHLHIIPGVGNDALEIMEDIYGTHVMDKFYEWHSFRKGGTPGGDFTGKSFFLPFIYCPSSLLLIVQEKSSEGCSMSITFLNSENILEETSMTLTPGSTTSAASSKCTLFVFGLSSQMTTLTRPPSLNSKMLSRLFTTSMECLRLSRSTFCQVCRN